MRDSFCAQSDLMALTLWQRMLPIMAQILYRLCHLLGADYEQTMRTLQAGGEEASEILMIVGAPPVLGMAGGQNSSD